VEIETPGMVRPLATLINRTHPRPQGMKEFISLLKNEASK
jgi:hypothetical protein